MKFPFWYTGVKTFYKPESSDSGLLISSWIKTINCQRIKQHCQLDGNYGLFNLHASVRFQFDTSGTTVQVKYFISLFESNIIFLTGLCFAGFFFYFQSYLYVGVAFIVGLVLYLTNTLLISNHIDKLLFKLGEWSEMIESQQLWEQQRCWLNDNSVCPACGEPKNQYAGQCLNCGLFFTSTGKPNFVSSLNNTANVDVNYNLTTSANTKNNAKDSSKLDHNSKIGST